MTDPKDGVSRLNFPEGFVFTFIFFKKLQLVCRSTDTAVSKVRCVLKNYEKQMS